LNYVKKWCQMERPRRRRKLSQQALSHGERSAEGWTGAKGTLRADVSSPTKSTNQSKENRTTVSASAKGFVSTAKQGGE